MKYRQSQLGVHASTVHTKLEKQRGQAPNQEKHHRLLLGILNVIKLRFSKCTFLSQLAQKWCRSSKEDAHWEVFSL